MTAEPVVLYLPAKARQTLVAACGAWSAIEMRSLAPLCNLVALPDLLAASRASFTYSCINIKSAQGRAVCSALGVVSLCNRSNHFDYMSTAPSLADDTCLA